MFYHFDGERPDYRTWPLPLRHPRSAEVAELRGELAERAEFHLWVQWLVAEQAAAAQRKARAAGMEIGIMHDLAVGAHPGGADAWAGHDVFVRGVSVGAPPDAFNQHGQNWSLPPWHPGHLAAQGYRPLADLIAAAAGDAGGLRIDHAMGLSRLWWIPEGMSPAQGAYVRYDHEATLGALAAQASRAGARLGLLGRSVAAERAEADKLVAAWLAALAREGLIRPGDEPSAAAFTVALYAYLAKTPALLIGVSLAEAARERRSQNMPGTTTEYPNWRLPLCGLDGAPILLEDLPGCVTLREVANAVAGRPG